MTFLQTHRPVFAVLLGGFIAATLDILYAFVSNAQYGRSPLWVLQFVASGWLGKESFAGGWTAGSIGLASHYLILFAAAGLYYLASRRFTFLRSQAVICGAVFGCLIYLFMNLVVWPLSAVPYKFTPATMRIVEGFASHALIVGIPIALCIRRWTAPR
jgi:hypothetical protein